jgi:hypothetical protein
MLSLHGFSDSTAESCLVLALWHIGGFAWSLIVMGHIERAHQSRQAREGVGILNRYALVEVKQYRSPETWSLSLIISLDAFLYATLYLDLR